MKIDIQHELKLYKETGKLSTHPHIYCTQTGTKVTAFGSNLASKIKKHGSLEQLLLTFVCRAGKTPNKPKVPKAPRKARVSKAQSKEIAIQEMLKDIPKMNFTRSEPISLLDNPVIAAQVTQSGCYRPDIFLDSDRSCDYCALYEVCRAPNRCVSRQGWQGNVLAN